MNRVATGVVVITGGSSGIGRCTAALFARKGWRVGLIARGAEGLASTREELEAAGARGATAQADVVDSDALSAAADLIAAELGPIDLWINCAGNGVYGPFVDVPQRDFQRVTDVTYHGTVNGIRIALAHMRPRRQGAIVNVCSAAAFHGLPMMSSYAGAKAAVRAFAQALQGELRLEGMPIRMSTVFPPAANTPFFSHAVSYMGWPARPAWPVYRPEIVAQGIWQAYLSGRSEMTISGTSSAFHLGARLTPGVIAWCMAQFGIDRQCTRSQEALKLLEPTLFEPSRRVFGSHGPFTEQARSWSSQLWFDRQRTRAGALFRWGRAPGRSRRDASSPPIRASRRRDPAPGDLDGRPGVS